MKKDAAAYIVRGQKIFAILEGVVLAAVLITVVDEAGAQRGRGGEQRHALEQDAV